MLTHNPIPFNLVCKRKPPSITTTLYREKILMKKRILVTFDHFWMFVNTQTNPFSKCMQGIFGNIREHTWLWVGLGADFTAVVLLSQMELLMNHKITLPDKPWKAERKEELYYRRVRKIIIVTCEIIIIYWALFKK